MVEFPELHVVFLLCLRRLPENIADMICIDCDDPIVEVVYHYSMDNFDHPLCRDCQDYLRNKRYYTSVTPLCEKLYYQLRKRGVDAELEDFDGKKTVDIVVHEAKLHIEVDGVHHNREADQALRDLQRSYDSFKRGYLTLRIPNSLVREHIEQAANLIRSFVTINTKRERRNRY